MKQKNKVLVQYKRGFAKVLVGNNEFKISRQDETSGDTLCPVDLISASLGT